MNTKPIDPLTDSDNPPPLHARLLGSGGRVVRPLIMELVLLALCVYLSFRSDYFLTVKNLLNVLNTVSIQGMIAFGMTMVIIAGEIDLSVGSAVAFSGCLTAWLVKWMISMKIAMPMAVTLAILASLSAGFVLGCLAGLMKTQRRVPTFITTLASMTILRGLAEEITHGFPLTPFPDWYNFIGAGHLFGIPFPAIIFILTFLVIQFLMNFTSFGRSIYAVGGNPEAARLSGINVRMIKIMVMGIVALLAAMSGVVESSQIMAGSSITAVGWELTVIAAVIIGGTSLLGGEGRIWGTLIGVIFLGVLFNGMKLLDVPHSRQLIVSGGVILIAVLINMAPAKNR